MADNKPLNEQTINKIGSIQGTGAGEEVVSTGSGQLGGSGKPISRNLRGDGKGDKWSKGEEEYVQDQAEFRLGDREKGALDNPDEQSAAE